MTETTNNNNKVYWVKGNTQPLIIPLEQEVMTEHDEIVATPYYPDGNAEVVVTFVGKWMKYNYTPIVDGNLLKITSDATLPAGCYGVEVVVKNQDGTQYRSLWDNQVVVTNSNPSVLQEWDEFKNQEVQARAALFFFAKGDKGDAFTYADFTQEQIEELQKPAVDAAAELTTEVRALESEFTESENQRVANENQRIDNEIERVNSETSREQQSASDHTTALEDHTTSVGDHTTAQSDHTTALSDHTQALSDHITANGDHTRAESDHALAATDHTTATSDHETAVQDNAQMTELMERAVADHVQAATDHTIAESDHTTATSDHVQAATDHTTAVSDHTQAGTDHSTATSDHTQAGADHTRAVSDHDAVEVFVDSLGVFDLSKYNAVGGVLATYADLSAALTALNALDSQYKYGGMSIKFVQSSDNKYVQYRLTNQYWSIDVDDWTSVDGEFATGEKVSEIGIDDEPTAGSDNLVKSGGVNDITEQLKGFPSTFHQFTLSMTDGKFISWQDGTIDNISGRAVSDLVDISEYVGCEIYVLFAGDFLDSLGYALYREDGTFIFGKRYPDILNWMKIDITTDTKYIRVSSKSANINYIALYAMKDAKDSYQSLKAKVEKHDIVINSMDIYDATTTIYGEDDSHNFKDTGGALSVGFFVKLPTGIYTKLKFYVNANSTITVNFYAYNEDVGRVIIVDSETLTNTADVRAIIEKDVFLDFTNKERLCMDLSVTGMKYSWSTNQYPGLPFYLGSLSSMLTANSWDACNAYNEGRKSDFPFSLEYLAGTGYDYKSIIRTVKTSEFFEGKKYVAYGDSIMVTAGEISAEEYVIPKLIGRFFGLITVNCAVSGSVPIGSSNLSDDNLAYVEADTMLVTISGGQNRWVTAEDINSTDRDTSIGAINYYIDHIRSISPKCIIVLCPTYIGNGDTQCAIDYQRIADNKHVGLTPTLDLHLIDWEGDKTSQQLRYDNIHPTKYGCIRFAAVCTHYLENYLL